MLQKYAFLCILSAKRAFSYMTRAPLSNKILIFAIIILISTIYLEITLRLVASCTNLFCNFWEANQHFSYLKFVIYKEKYYLCSNY